MYTVAKLGKSKLLLPRSARLVSNGLCGSTNVSVALLLNTSLTLSIVWLKV